MAQDNNRDIIILKKILRYISEIKRIIEKFNIKSHTDLENEYIALSSATQTVTNVNELKKALDEKILKKIPIFEKIKTNTKRNIASHDYDSISSFAVYSVITKLVSDENIKEIEAVINEIANESAEQ